jgi:hypothetical protein
MALLVRIRGWRTRRKDRKAEELLAVTALCADDTAGIERVQDRVRNDYWKGHVVELGDWDPAGHAGEDGRPTKH